ncbi:MAG: energy transducer TonB [Betaproteobacteria bacterium]|nr:energy transducer TonB [Betaproteobacteria bacterium]
MIAQAITPPLGSGPGIRLPRNALLLSLAAHAAALLLLPGLQRHTESTALPPLSVILQPPASAMAAPAPAPVTPAAPERAAQPMERPRPAAPSTSFAPTLVAAAAPARVPPPPASAEPQSTTPRPALPTAAASATTATVAATATPPLPPAPEAGPSPAVLARSLEDYGRSLSNLLARQQQYPRLAALRGWEGEVRLRLRVARKGSLVAVQVERSSGYEVLDQQALQLVQGATLPLPPESLGDREFQIVVPVNYRLQPAT